MKVLIDISEDVYKQLKDGNVYAGNTFFDTALESISNGVVLPAGHGRLIDAEDVDNHNNPTGDLISREALKATLQYKSECIDCSDECCTSCFYDIIDNAPTIETKEIAEYTLAYGDGYQDGHKEGYDKGYHDAERPQGKWINHRNDYGHNIADCSLCGKAMQWHAEDEDGIPRYCWYCGAEMGGGVE